MYALLTLLMGAVIAVMIPVNGNLTAQYGAFWATAIVYAVGSATGIILAAAKKDKNKIFGQGPLWIYLGGAISVGTIVCENLAFGNISMTSIVALELLGQTVAAILVDRFGLLGMERRPFNKTNLVGIALSLVGIFVMFDSSIAPAAITAVFLSLAAGASIVVSRSANANLAAKVGSLKSSVTAYITGFPLSVLVALFMAKENLFEAAAVSPFKPWMYIGGALGVTIVLMSNLIVPKVSSFKMTILIFVGQVFTSASLDLLMGREYPKTSFLGGVIIALGIAANYLLEYLAARKKPQE